MSTKEEQRTVALEFVKHGLMNKLITPGLLEEKKLLTLFVRYKNDHPSSVQVSEIVDALKETCLIKRKNQATSANGVIEFKDQIFNLLEGVSPQLRDLLNPRIRVARRYELRTNSRIPNGVSNEVHEYSRCSHTSNYSPEDENVKKLKLLRKRYRHNKQSFIRYLKFLFIEEIPVDRKIFTLHREENYPIRITNVSKTPLSVCFLNALCIENNEAVSLASFESGFTINKNETFELMLSVNFKNYGIKVCPIVIELNTFDTDNIIELLLEVSFNVISEHLLDLEATEQYQPPIRNRNGFVPLPAIRGGFLPTKNLLPMKLHLNEFSIPPSLRNIFDKNFKAEKMVHSNEIELRKLRKLLCNETFSKILHNREALNVKNYVERFRILMWLEEYKIEKELAMYNQTEVKVKYEKERELVRMKVPGLAEGRPSLMKGDRVAFREKVATKKFEGMIHNIEEESILIKLNKQFTENFLYVLPLDVEFSLNRSDFKLCHRALNQMDHRKMTSFMFPKKNTESPKKKNNKEIRISKFFNPKIIDNEEQVKAIKNIIKNSAFPAPYILFGPPGTGKTATLVEAIVQIWHKFHRNTKICICAPSNSAADLITLRLLEYKLPAYEIIRLYAMSRSDGEIPDALKKCSNYDRLSKEIYFPSKEAIEFKTVVVLTPVTAGRLVTGGITGGHFEYLFMDEAGHAVEPEMVVPIIGLMTTPASGSSKPSVMKGSLILAGDPEQLGPVIQSKLAALAGLNMSLLERLMIQSDLYQKDEKSKYNPKYITKLVNNYRSHKSILDIPNRLFYENELEIKGDADRINRAVNWEGLVERGFPLIFHSVKGQESRESNSPSYFNVHEVQVVEDYLKKLINHRLGNGIVKQSDIGIISPYKKQVQKIKKQLAKSNWTDITVASVEEFQGQERLVMIISTVRSQPKLVLSHDYQFGLGFLKNKKRFNVAVTRAMALLIIVGNPDILLCDPNWRALINFCISNFAYTGDKPSHTVPDDFQPQEKIVKEYSALTIFADNYPEDYVEENSE